MELRKNLSLSNYTAISILERLGLSSPTQAQIDIMESMVQIAVHPEKTTPRKVKRCVGDDELAYSFLYLSARTTEQA